MQQLLAALTARRRIRRDRHRDRDRARERQTPHDATDTEEVDQQNAAK